MYFYCSFCIFVYMYMWCENESELANTVFKIQPNKADSFFCFLLFVQSFNRLYQLPNLCGVFTKLKPKQYPNRKCQKTEIIFFNFKLILLDCITYCEMKTNKTESNWNIYNICYLSISSYTCTYITIHDRHVRLPKTHWDSQLYN